MRIRLSPALLLVCAGTLLALAPADAQNAQVRSGIWFNAGLGVGSYGCEGCDGRESGGTGGLALGGTLSRKFLLGGGVNVWTKQVEDVTVTVGTVTALVRFYPSETGGFFLLGGLGYGVEQVSVDNFSLSESGAGAILGLGVDIRIGRNVSLTPFWNGLGISLDSGNSNVGQLGLGITVH